MSTRAEVAEAFCATTGHRFVGAVGAGAFKETFHIVLATGETQALKVFQPGFSPERTSRELSAMQRCSHPNIGRLTAIAWLALAWRQFLFWFADIEGRLETGAVAPATLLRNADSNWRILDDSDVLLEERRNDGGWIRPWRRALTEFRTA